MQKCQYEKNNIQCNKPIEQNQKFCKRHLKNIKEETFIGTTGGAMIGALLIANPIGVLLSAVAGGVYAYNIHKHKNK